MRELNAKATSTAVSVVVHIVLFASLAWQATKPPPPAPKVVHMKLSVVEHKAAPKVAAPPPAPAPVVAPAPAPVVAEAPKPVAKPKPVPKVKPKPQLVKPKPVAKPLPLAEVKPVAKPQPVATPPPAPVKPKPLPAKAPAPAADDADFASDGDAGDGDDATDSGDQSAEALLIRTTLVKPEYTTEALFARLEGLFAMNVQIDPTGKVLGAQLTKKVGFGMDQRIIASVLHSRFQPGRDQHGRPLGGWVKIKFKLEIPD